MRRRRTGHQLSLADPEWPTALDNGLPRGGERTADADLERLFAARLSTGGFKLNAAPRLPNNTAVCRLRSAMVARAPGKPSLGQSRWGPFRIPIVKNCSGCSRPAAMPSRTRHVAVIESRAFAGASAPSGRPQHMQVRRDKKSSRVAAPCCRRVDRTARPERSDGDGTPTCRVRARGTPPRRDRYQCPSCLCRQTAGHD